MDSGWAAVIGSVVGVLGTLGTGSLNVWLGRKKKDPVDETAKNLLRQMLEAPAWKWRKITTLANVVGTDEPTVRRLLLEIGARGSMTNPGRWGLVSRNPIEPPDDFAQGFYEDEIQEDEVRP